MKQKTYLYIGIIILLLLLISAFIKLPAESGSNYNITTPLLGILIFYSPIVLGIYLITGLILIFLGLKKIKFV